MLLRIHAKDAITLPRQGDGLVSGIHPISAEIRAMRSCDY